MSHPSDPLNILDADQHQELNDIQNYLRGHAKAGTTPAEGSFNAVLNRASPTVRQFIANNRTFVQDLDAGGGRYRPFQERIDLVGNMPKEDKAVLDRVHTEELTHSLNERMGTTTPDEPTSLRDIVSASYDANEGAA